MADDNTAEVRENARKVREGQVTSNGMDKTAVVVVVTRKPHPRYRKTMARTTRLYVHDEENTSTWATGCGSPRPARCRS